MSKTRPLLSNRLYLPEEDVPPRILEAFTYSFTRMEEERIEDDQGNFVEIKNHYYKEVHHTFKQRNGKIGFHRGDIGKLKKFFGRLDWEDRRAVVPMGASLRHDKGFGYRHDQGDCVKKMIESGGGLQIAPTGWGKTIFGISVAIELNQRTLILASRTNWLQDWMKDLRKHTNIEELEEKLGYPLCGVINNKTSKDKLFPCINFSTFQTFFSKRGKSVRGRELRDCFGLVIADEASMLPAKETGGVFTAFNPKWRVALSADEKRADKLHKLTYDYVGPVVARGKRQDSVVGTVHRHESGLNISANHLYGVWLGSLQSRICKNPQFTRSIVDAVIEDVIDGYKVMIITKTRKHVEQMAAMLAEEKYPVQQRNKKTGKKRTIYRYPEVEIMMGGDRMFDEKKARARRGEIDIIVATEVVQMNTDIDRMDCLHDIMPVNNDQTIRQRWGRVGRAHVDKKEPRVHIWHISAYPAHHPASRYLSNGWARKEEWALRQGYKVVDVDYEGGMQTLKGGGKKGSKNKGLSLIPRRSG